MLTSRCSPRCCACSRDENNPSQVSRKGSRTPSLPPSSRPITPKFRGPVACLANPHWMERLFRPCPSVRTLKHDATMSNQMGTSKWFLVNHGRVRNLQITASSSTEVMPLEWWHEDYPCLRRRGGLCTIGSYHLHGGQWCGRKETGGRAV